MSKNVYTLKTENVDLRGKAEGWLTHRDHHTNIRNEKSPCDNALQNTIHETVIFLIIHAEDHFKHKHCSISLLVI